MNIQIFGTKKNFDSKKAERYFKERGIKYQFIDMKEKMDQFNEDEELVLAASKRQLVKIQHHQEKVRIRQEGKEEGLKEGELLKAKENTLMLFKSKYPQEDILMLENLTLSQYNEIFKALIENKDLQIIKEMIK